MSDETPDTELPNDNNRPSLNDVIFVGIGMPEVLASRVMRGYVIDEILAALLHAGILTKDQLSNALTQGENAVQKTSDKLAEAGKTSEESAKAAVIMTETAKAISKRLRDQFIDPPPSTSE
jgi:hypothetical protein